MLIYTPNRSFFSFIVISCSNALVEYIDMCLALEGKRLNWKQYPCKADKDCECKKEDRPECLAGQCWCFFPPSSANKHT